MNYTFFFFICASIAFGLSVISICIAPIINNYIGGEWGNKNCAFISDEYDYDKKNTPNPTERQKSDLNEQKRQLICDVFFGGVCALLGLLHYLEVGKTIEKKTGLLGIIAGTIGFVLTLVYVIFSAYIFNNDYYYETNNYKEKLFPNGAYVKYNGYKYIHNYDEEKVPDDPNIKYIKYNEIGQKQYNYDHDLYINSLDHTTTSNGIYRCRNPIFDENTPHSTSNCDYIWKSLTINSDIKMKYIYDRWITTLIFCVLIAILNAGIILFGFFLFTQSESNPGSTPIPMISGNV